MTSPLTISSRPVRGSGLWVRQSGDETVLVDGEHERVHLLNETALALWELCDGETTVEEMVMAATGLFDADADRLQRDVLDALQAMRDRELILVL
jgi:hypothetical protein